METKYKNEFGETIEEYVFRDAKGFQTKLKTKYYNKWKGLRGKVHNLFKSNIPISNQVFEADELEFLSWCKDKGEDFVKCVNIIALRKMWSNKCLESGN